MAEETDISEKYQNGIVYAGLASETQHKVSKPSYFATPRSEEQIMFDASQDSNFVRNEDSVANQRTIEFENQAKNAMVRKGVNAASYLLSIMAGGETVKDSSPKGGITGERVADQKFFYEHISQGIGLPDEDNSAGSQTMGTIIDVGSMFYGGSTALKVFDKLHRTAQVANWLKNSASLTQKTVAVVAGESAALNVVSPEEQSGIVGIARMFNLENEEAQAAIDASIYFMSHDMDDSKVEKFLKTFTGDLVLAKTFEKLIFAIPPIMKSMREFKATQSNLSEVSPRIKGLVDQGDVSNEAQAQKLLESLDARFPDDPMGDEVFDQIAARLIQGRADAQLVQLAAGRKFTEGSTFTTESGDPMIFSHKGSINGKPTGYAQDPIAPTKDDAPTTPRKKSDRKQDAEVIPGLPTGNMGFHLTSFTDDVTEFETKGDLELFWVNVKHDDVLRLADTSLESDVAINSLPSFIEEVSALSRFDINEIKIIQDQAELLTNQQLVDIVLAEGLDPKNYNLEAVRNNYIFERVVDSAGYRAVTYENKIQGGMSIVLVDPDKTMASIYSKKTKSTSSLAVKDLSSPIGVRTLTDSEAGMAEELMTITKQQEEELGVHFGPNAKNVKIDFNWARYPNTPEGVIGMMNDISLTSAPMITKATRGKITHDLTQTMARELDWDIKNIVSRQEGGTWNAEQMLASRHVMLASANRLDQLAGKINMRMATDVDKLAFSDQMRLHALIQAQVKGAQTEIARAMSAMRIGAEAEVVDYTRLLGIENIDDMAAQFVKTRGLKEQNKFAKIAAHDRWKTWLYVYSNALLSNPLTQVKNFSGNLAYQVYQIPESLVTQSIATTRRAVTGASDGARFSDNIAAIAAFPGGLKEGLILGRKAWSTQRASDKMSKIDFALGSRFNPEAFNVDADSMWGRGIELAGFAFGAPGRALLTMDEFFKGFTYHMQQNITANQRLMQGISDKMDDVELTNQYFRDKNGYSPDVNEVASASAHELTFTKDMDGILQSFQLMRHKFPPVQMVVPFFRAPVNILGAALSRTPLAGISKKVREDLIAGGPRADKAMAKIGLGTILSMVIYNEAVEGRITGGGSGQRELDKHMESTGREPYSLVFTDEELSPETLQALTDMGIDTTLRDNKVFIPYRSFEPISTIMAMSADLSDFYRYYNDDHNEGTIELASQASALAIRNVSNTTFLNNIYDLLRATQEPDVYLVPWLGNMIASTLPFSGAVGAVERIQDPEVRVANTPRSPTDIEQAFYKLLGRAQGRIPGYSEDLPLGLNVWGDVRTYNDGHWTTMMNPAHTIKGKREAIDFEIERLGNVIRMPSDEIDGVVLGAQEYNSMVGIMNTIEVYDRETGITGGFKDVLNALVQLPMYGTLTRDEQIGLIDSVRNTFLNSARSIMIASDFSLQQDIEELKMLEAADKLEARGGIQ